MPECWWWWWCTSQEKSTACKKGLQSIAEGWITACIILLPTIAILIKTKGVKADFKKAVVLSAFSLQSDYHGDHHHPYDTEKAGLWWWLKWIKWRRSPAPDLALQAPQRPPAGLFGRLYTYYTYTNYTSYTFTYTMYIINIAHT